MNVPDYQGGSIVNLMSSISRSYGVSNGYAELKVLPGIELTRSKNIVLVVIDGMGHEYLREKQKDSFLFSKVSSKMTSVFPATTASAITTFSTGTAPLQHALTGWFMYLKEIGAVTTILPFMTRAGQMPLHWAIDAGDVLTEKPFSKKIPVPSYNVTPAELIGSEYTEHHWKNSLGYETGEGFFRQIKNAVRKNDSKKFIYGYVADLDSIIHKVGSDHKKTDRVFRKIDQGIERLMGGLAGTSTTLIVTADHGLIDTPVNRTLYLDSFPQLKEYLTLPFCGDSRTVYCYVHPDRKKEFCDFVDKRLGKYCDLYSRDELLKMDVFGLGKPHPALKERIGDYILIMKENYAFKDKLVHEKRSPHLGNHGGVSDWEMFVPLIVFKA